MQGDPLPIKAFNHLSCLARGVWRTAPGLFYHHKNTGTMIFRTNDISNNADEISFKLSFSYIDCKRWLAQYLSILIRCGITDYTDNESSIRHWLEQEPFKNYPVKYAERLSRWAVSTAIRKKFLSPSATNPTTLIFAESIIKKASE